MSTSVRRLYKELKPTHYDLEMVPDAAKLQFRGTVTIHLKKTGRPSQRLTFHQHGLKITSARVIKHDKKGDCELHVSRINNQNTLDEVRIHTSEMVYGGAYEVTMAFEGAVSQGMSGLYVCPFKVGDEEHALLATQFESHYARKAFPCIDEPEAKATFRLTLVTPEGHKVLSNTPVATQEKVSETSAKTTFEETPRMSTYLLAFVIGELHGKRAKTKRGIEVAAWATIAQPLESLDFGLDVAAKAIDFYEEYFGVEYPLAKADHVALPDFSNGAMENWGLITYRERALLVYPGETTQPSMEYTATAISHEVAHQWFGDLVTMKWWDDLWLNESFASVMENDVVDAVFPEWHVWEYFVMHDGILSLRRDAAPGVQAVKSDVHHPDEINALFDPFIVYAKGSRLLQMLKTYIGEAAFRKGLTHYFEKHAYGNTTGDDLWQALHETSGIDVGAFMRPWLERSGFPVVAVEQDGRELTMRQTHFLEGGQESDGRVWHIPLFANQAELPDRLDKAEAHFKLASDELVLVNQNYPGHYIVHYVRPEQRMRITELIRQKSLGPVDRLMLLNSASMLAKAGYQSFADVLTLLAAYEDEQTEAVWDIMALIIGEARRFIDYDEGLEPLIKAFIRTLVPREYERLGWDEKDGESPADRKLRATIIGLGAYADDPDITNEALKRFKLYRREQNGVAADLRSIVFSVAVRQKADKAFDFLLKLHDETVSGDLKSDIMAALTGTHDTKEANVLLGRLQDARLVKAQDADYWLIFLLRNRHMREVAWQWMVDNWDWVVETYGHDNSYDDFPRYAAGVCNTAAWEKKYAGFFEPKQGEVVLKRNIQVGLAEIRTRVAWLERDLAAVRAFFERFESK